MRPVLAGRGRKRLETLADELGGLEVARRRRRRAAQRRARSSTRATCSSRRSGRSRAGASRRSRRRSTQRAHYLDSTGESTFIRRVFESAGPRAESEGVALLTAMGYDWVPGQPRGRAGAARGRRARAARARSATSSTGARSAGVGGAISGGTRASAAGALLEPGFTFRDGRLVDERPARRVASFETHDGRREPGDLGRLVRAFHAAAPAPRAASRSTSTSAGSAPPRARCRRYVGAGIARRRAGRARGPAGSVAGRFVKGSSGGPTPRIARARALARRSRAPTTATGNELCRVRLEGPNGYDLTAAFLAWGAERAAAGALHGDGALGPVDGFGLDELEAAARELRPDGDVSRGAPHHALRRLDARRLVADQDVDLEVGRDVAADGRRASRRRSSCSRWPGWRGVCWRDDPVQAGLLR